jgi:hypothetical protein
MPAGILLPSLTVLLAAAGASGMAQRRLGKPFEYDVEALEHTDPQLIIGEETGRIKVSFAELHAVAVGPEDRVYVAGDHAVMVFDAGGIPSGRMDLGRPARCLAVDTDGTVFAGTSDGVHVLDASGRPKAHWPLPAENPLPTSLAVTEDAVLVADAGRRAVYRLNKSGEVLGRITGQKGEAGRSGFVVPSPYFDVCATNVNAVWVVNPGKHALECYGRDGDLLASWQRDPVGIDGFCGCCNPTHIARLRDGSFVTSEKGLVRIKLYTATGDFVGVVAGPESFSEGLAGLDLAVDSKDRVLALDQKAGAVRVFEVTPP